MAKSLEQTKSALKLRTTPRDGALTLRLGVRKYVLPFEVRLLQSEEFVFVHIPPSAEILQVVDGELKIVEDLATAEKAAGTFRKTRKKASPGAGKAAKNSDVPSDVMEALSKIPSGYKVGYDAEGKPKLIRTRKRGK